MVSQAGSLGKHKVIIHGVEIVIARLYITSDINEQRSLALHPVPGNPRALLAAIGN